MAAAKVGEGFRYQAVLGKRLSENLRSCEKIAVILFQRLEYDELHRH